MAFYGVPPVPYRPLVRGGRTGQDGIDDPLGQVGGVECRIPPDRSLDDHRRGEQQDG